jgi:hypothetical protein
VHLEVFAIIARKRDIKPISVQIKSIKMKKEQDLKEMVISSMENVTTVEKLGTKKQIVGRRKKINIKGQRVLNPEVQKLQHRQLIMDQELNFYCVE